MLLKSSVKCRAGVVRIVCGRLRFNLLVLRYFLTDCKIWSKLLNSIYYNIILFIDFSTSKTNEANLLNHLVFS